MSSEVFHFEGPLQVYTTQGRAPGRDPQNRTYSSWASFADPDGNTWMLQEITTRLPGRGFGVDVPAMTTLLKEAENNHGNYEADRSEASLVGPACGLHHRAPERKHARGGGRSGGTPHGHHPQVARRITRPGETRRPDRCGSRARRGWRRRQSR